MEKEIESIIQSFKLVLQIFTHNIGIPGHDNNLRERGKKKKDKRNKHIEIHILYLIHMNFKITKSKHLRKV